MRAVGERTVAILICLAALGMCDLAAPQSPNPLRFAVASVKEVSPNAMPPYHMDPTSLTYCGSVRGLVVESRGVLWNQVNGGPTWANSTLYEIEAKTAGPSSKAQIMEMLQTLLADRFHLVVQQRVKMESGYALVVDKRGPKLPPPDEHPPGDEGVIAIGGGVWAHGTTLKRLADGLWTVLQTPVVDQTKIEGRYDIRLRFDPPGAATRYGSVFTALREFGLKLEPRKIPVESYTIVSVDRPVKN